MGPDKTTSPAAPPIFNAYDTNSIALVPLLNVNVPASLLILDADANVVKPLKILAPKIFLITPAPPIPVPYTVILSASVIAAPSPICKALPSYIVVVPPFVPKALLLVITLKIPAAGVLTVPTDIFPV